MTKMTRAEFEHACIRAFDAAKPLVPNPRTRGKTSTGNLANNGIRIEFPEPFVCRVYADLTKAYYMPYTTEPWISPRWHGAKNPNEGWWETYANFFLDALAKEFSGDPKDAEGSAV